jgi:Tfp pilus assembly protein PilZ
MRLAPEDDIIEFKEKREFDRKKIHVPVRYSIDMIGEYLGFVHDISYGGMFFESKENHKVCDEIQADLNVELYGKIVWMHGYVIRATEKGIAVKFTHFDKNGLDEIMQLEKQNYWDI